MPAKGACFPRRVLWWHGGLLDEGRHFASGDRTVKSRRIFCHVLTVPKCEGAGVPARAWSSADPLGRAGRRCSPCQPSITRPRFLIKSLIAEEAASGTAPGSGGGCSPRLGARPAGIPGRTGGSARDSPAGSAAACGEPRCGRPTPALSPSRIPGSARIPAFPAAASPPPLNPSSSGGPGLGSPRCGGARRRLPPAAAAMLGCSGFGGGGCRV